MQDPEPSRLAAGSRRRALSGFRLLSLPRSFSAVPSHLGRPRSPGEEEEEEEEPRLGPGDPPKATCEEEEEAAAAAAEASPGRRKKQEVLRSRQQQGSSSTGSSGTFPRADGRWRWKRCWDGERPGEEPP